ncbi:MAG: hypothetical protein AABY32_00060 [Nanoarchaeota archaeon]
MGNKDYQMNGSEYFPIIGAKIYQNRINKIPKMNMQEILIASGEIAQAKLYHMITGVSSVILAGIGIYAGLETLIK